MKLEEVNAKILEGLSGKERQAFEAGLKALTLNMANPADLEDREALKESFRKAKPDWTEKALEAAVQGRAPDAKKPGTLKESFIRAGMSEKEAEIATKG